MSFALMGDMILCARSAYFLQAFRRIGLVPDCGSTWLLPRLIGKARSVELSLMGERLPAEKALEWGLVNRVYDDAVLMEETMKLAHELANGPTIALSLIRKLYWESPENSFEDQLNLEFQSQRDRGRGGGFQGRRHRVPREAAGQIQGQMMEAALGRCVAVVVSGRDRRDRRGQAFRRRQPGDLVVRYRASRRQYRRDPAPRAAGLWRGADARGRPRCRGSADAARV